MNDKLPPHRARAAQKQQAILDYIQRVSDAPPWSPTLAEIREALGFKHCSNVEYHVRQLEQQGRIRIIHDMARGIRLKNGMV